MNAQHLKDFRKKWKLSQVKLANLLGMYVGHISRVEREERGFSRRMELELEKLEVTLKGGKNGQRKARN